MFIETSLALSLLFAFLLGNDSLLDFSCFQDIKAAGKDAGTQAILVNTRQLQAQLQQTQQLSDWYREQCIKQEEEMSKLKEEGTCTCMYAPVTYVHCLCVVL